MVGASWVVMLCGLVGGYVVDIMVCGAERHDVKCSEALQPRRCAKPCRAIEVNIAGFRLRTIHKRRAPQHSATQNARTRDNGSR